MDTYMDTYMVFGRTKSLAHGLATHLCRLTQIAYTNGTASRPRVAYTNGLLSGPAFTYANGLLFGQPKTLL